MIKNTKMSYCNSWSNEKMYNNNVFQQVTVLFRNSINMLTIFVWSFVTETWLLAYDKNCFLDLAS